MLLLLWVSAWSLKQSRPVTGLLVRSRWEAGNDKDVHRLGVGRAERAASSLPKERTSEGYTVNQGPRSIMFLLTWVLLLQSQDCTAAALACSKILKELSKEEDDTDSTEEMLSLAEEYEYRAIGESGLVGLWSGCIKSSNLLDAFLWYLLCLACSHYRPPWRYLMKGYIPQYNYTDPINSVHSETWAFCM